MPQITSLLLALCVIVLSSCVFVMRPVWFKSLDSLCAACNDFLQTYHMSLARKEVPFKFLQLPPELRLMVYERLEDTSPQRVDFTRTHGTTVSTLSLIATPPPPSAILATCRLINQEARGIIKPMVRRYIEAGLSAPYLEADFRALGVLQARDGLFHHILESCKIHVAQGASNPKLSEYKADLHSLHKCITRFKYKSTTSPSAAAQILDIFIKMSTRAILETGTLYGQSYPRHTLPTSQGRRIDIMFCQQNKAVEFEVEHDFFGKVCVDHIAWNSCKMEEMLPKIVDRWFEGVGYSVYVARMFMRNTGVTSVVVIVGEVPSWARERRFYV